MGCGNSWGTRQKEATSAVGGRFELEAPKQPGARPDWAFTVSMRELQRVWLTSVIFVEHQMTRFWPFVE